MAVTVNSFVVFLKNKLGISLQIGRIHCEERLLAPTLNENDASSIPLLPLNQTNNNHSSISLPSNDTRSATNANDDNNSSASNHTNRSSTNANDDNNSSSSNCTNRPSTNGRSNNIITNTIRTARFLTSSTNTSNHHPLIPYLEPTQNLNNNVHTQLQP